MGAIQGAFSFERQETHGAGARQAAGRGRNCQPDASICVKVNDAARANGVGRTRPYALIASGAVEAIELGSTTPISTASRHELVMRQRDPE